MVEYHMLMEREEKIWRIDFLQENSALSGDSLAEIITKACQMYESGEYTRIIRSRNSQGTLTTNKKTYAIGHFAGRAFEAELETNHGAGSLHFLLLRRIDEVLN